MARLWPVLVLLVALGAIAYFVVGGEEGGLLGEAVDHEEEEDYAAPELRGHRRGEDWRNPTERAQAPMETKEADPKAVRRERRQLFLQGRVLDERTQQPLAGARVWLIPHEEPCPRLLAAPEERIHVGWEILTTDAGGRFRFEDAADRAPATRTVDLFGTAPGHVLGTVCTVEIPGDVTLRLAEGLKLRGRIRSPEGRPVQGAVVRARPGPETQATPGHGTVGLFLPRSDEEGRFTIDGLLPGALILDVEHDHFMPKTVGPRDPEDTEEVEITLVPALRATFRLRTDDGRDPEHPTLRWQTTGSNPRSEVMLLAAASDLVERESRVEARPAGEMTSTPVRLPCDARSVVLEIKADGYATWRSEPLRLPPEGGEETYEITLTGDLATGSARIALEDDRGDKVDFAAAGVEVEVMRLTPASRSSTYVLEQREDLRITDLPAGPYRILLRSARFAPLQADLTIEVGQETESLLRTRPPAKVKVRFLGDSETMVRFRLTQGGEVVHGVPEGAFSRGTDEATGEPILSAGSDGLLLSGLAAGTYTVEVLSEEHTAPPTVVHLVEGDTVETEIRVHLR